MTMQKKGDLPPGELNPPLNDAPLNNNPPNNTPSSNARIDVLKKKINNEEYLFEAIHRIAFVLSNEISGNSGGGSVERKG
jgi:hypothetical protein